MNLPTKLVLPTTLAQPSTPAPAPSVAVPTAPVAPVVTATPAAPPVSANGQPMLTPEELNDLRLKVMNGEPVDRDLLRRARDQLRQRNSMTYMGVKKAKDADELAGAVNTGVLDF